MSKKNFILSSIKMSIATLSSRVLGFLREIIFAHIFGASGLTDAYHVAFRIPNMLRDLFAEGSFSAAFVPIFTGEKSKNEDDGIRLFWTMAVVLLILTSIVSIIVFIWAPEIVTLLTDDKFISDEERFLLCVNLTKLMAPFLTFVSLAALFLGVLNTYKMFFGPALAPASFNVVMISSMLLLPSYLESQGIHAIYSLGIGVFLGGVMQMIFQVPMLYKKSILTFKGFVFSSPRVKDVLARMSIGTIGVAANQINLFVTTILATGTVLGAVSWLSYAFRLFQFPVGILGVSIGNANLVHFSEKWKSGNKDEAISFLQTSYLSALFVMIPAMVVLFVLGEETVNLAFKRGAFNAKDSEMVTLALKAYLIGLPFYGLYKVFSPSFYTIDKHRVAVAISSSSVLINIIFCLSLVDSYGFKILAFGTSLSMFYNVTMLSLYLTKHLGLKLSFFFPLRFFKILISGTLTCAVIMYAKDLMYDFGYSSPLVFVVGTFLGALSYLMVLCVVGDYHFVRSFLNKLFKRKSS